MAMLPTYRVDPCGYIYITRPHRDVLSEQTSD